MRSLFVPGTAGIALLLLLGPSVRPTPAQVLYGSVVGTVTDQSDAVVPNATVTLTSKDTGLGKEAQTDTGGRYSLVNVLPGRYDIKVSAKGFRAFSVTDFEVSPNVIGRMDVKLEVGQLTETISVEATAALLQTDKSDTHAEIHTDQVVGLPVGGYRNYENLVNLVPGAMPTALQNSITDTPGRALAININGGNAQTN
ncbi:MAG TPA: carboxypeptidase-like regulatory domain-containing protein, partial [Verrucomicrobiae bacterium]|nr:carboxypeptidase-like regulatory domain-containing protein [Verrucomicrobiae bacterium]